MLKVKLKRLWIGREKKGSSFFAILIFLFFGGLGLSGCITSDKLVITKGTRISLIGNNLGARMMHYGFFETEVQLKFPDHLLVIRNLCDGGNTPGFRPHSGRNEHGLFRVLPNFRMTWLKIRVVKGILKPQISGWIGWILI